MVFDALTTEDLTRIVDIQLAALATRLAARRLTLEVTDAAREWLALNGFDPLYGARPLRRLVQTRDRRRAGKALLAGEIRDGQTVRVDALPTGPGCTRLTRPDPDDVSALSRPTPGTARTTPTRSRSGTRWASARSSSAASGCWCSASCSPS